MKGKYQVNNIPKNESTSTRNVETIESNVRCGIGWFAPKWLQIFASKKAFVVVYALAGMQMHIVASYFIGTVSTMEKSFNMSSTMSGVISAAWDVGIIVTNIIVTYIAARGHRTRWVALGLLIISISSFVRTLPYLIFGAGESIKLYTKEYGSSLTDSSFQMESTARNMTPIKKLTADANCETSTTNISDLITFLVTLIAQISTGMGTAVYWTCGAAYLDDNARKNVVPVLLSFVEAIRLLGPTIGFLISSYALEIYVDPQLTPTINNEDPRWIGAWWIGWYPIAIMSFVCAFALALFPKMLPRAAMRKVNESATSKNNNSLSLTDFKKSIRRILKNKILLFNSLSSVSFAIGVIGGWMFMPKYMESQFRLSASKSNFLSGTVGILSNALGIMSAGLIISKLKPPPRYLAGWNVIVEFLDVFGHIGYTWLSCPQQNYHGHWNADHSWNLTETCNKKFDCGPNIQYGPVCDLSNNLIYYSSCHAGCTTSSILNETLTYNNCHCVSGEGSVVDGLCPIDCSANILIFIIMLSTLSFTSAMGRTCNTLIQFRCVEEQDKSLSIGVTETLISLLAFIPAPIFYGMIMDWTCMVWGENCGSRGNCWIYDNTRLRFGFNLIAALFLFIGTILDCFVWYHSKDLKMYDEDCKEELELFE